jgi:hypothetical protein
MISIFCYTGSDWVARIPLRGVLGVEWRELSGTDKRGLSLVSLVDRIVAFHGQTKFVRATKDFVFVVFLWFFNFRHSRHFFSL